MTLRLSIIREKDWDEATRIRLAADSRHHQGLLGSTSNSDIDIYPYLITNIYIYWI